MSALSRDQFIACLKKSKVMDDEAIDSWMSRVADEDPKAIAAKLVRDKMLTRWQAKLLLSGRARLTVGNYRLLSRINRDELGDRFEAIHSQLGRKVVIQIFPSSINKDDELRGRVLKAMQKMTELDHPGLVHVYDVDQEGDRYFVVTEFIDGTALSDLPRGDLKDSDVASIISDLITGVKYAHQEDVIHGNILQENVLVTGESRGKLQGLSTSAVRCEMSDTSGKLSCQQDFTAISQLGCSVLQEVPPKRRGEGYDSLVKIVGALASAEGSVLEENQKKLAEWLDEYDPKIPSADPLAAQQGGFDSPVAALPPAKLAKKKAEPESESESASFLSKMWNEKRTLSLAAIAATVLALVGGIGTAGYMLTQPSTTQSNAANALAKRDRNSNAPASSTASASAKDGPSTENRRRNEFKLERLADGDGSLSAARSDDALDPEATKRKFAELYAERNAAVDQPPATLTLAEKRTARREAARKEAARKEAARKEAARKEAARKEAARKKDAKKAAASDTADSPLTSKPVTEDPKEDQTVTASKSPGKETKAAETAMLEPVAKSATKPVEKKKPSKPKGDPFAKLPETVDLPPVTQTGDVKIADLTIDKRYLMGLELLAGPEICKQKFMFDLKRSASDKQLWDIRMQRGKRDDPLPVAQIQKTPTEVKFRWLREAEEFDNANYIRNCKIKLSASKDFGWIGLRKPVDIKNFAFESGKTSVKAEIDLEWLPNPQGIRIELDAFQAEESGGKLYKGKVFYSPREVTKKAPGVILFREKDILRFFFLEVGVEIRSKVKMQAQMIVLGADGAPRLLKKQADLLQLLDVLTVRESEAERYQAVIERAKNKAGVLKIFPNLKDEGDFRAISSKAKKATSLATEQKAACEDYVKIVENLIGLKIPFQIFFDMDGHRIKLAQSTGN